MTVAICLALLLLYPQENIAAEQARLDFGDSVELKVVVDQVAAAPGLLVVTEYARNRLFQISRAGRPSTVDFLGYGAGCNSLKPATS